MQRNIEQLIEIICAKQAANSSDLFFFNSLSRQFKKKIALTNKQHELAKSKLIAYKSFFATEGVDDFEESLDRFAIPLRVADKEKSIQLESSSTNFLKIKFPFNKKEISIIENLKKAVAANHRSYYKKNNCHYFLYSEETTYMVLNAFAHRNFTVEKQLQDTYEKIKYIKDNPHLYIPGIYGNCIKNLHKNAQHALITEIGNLSPENSIKYLDRKLRFGLEKIEFSDELAEGIEAYSPCAVKIASRENADYLSRPDDEKLDDLLNSIIELDRFPLLVVLSDQISPTVVFNQLTSVHGFFSKTIGDDSQSVLFRLDHTNDITAKQFNSYIKENKNNNWVDSSTKVVYINYDKLPKVIFKSNWTPVASLSFSNLTRSFISTYIESTCDLNIVREKDFSIIKQYKKNK